MAARAGSRVGGGSWRLLTEIEGLVLYINVHKSEIIIYNKLVYIAGILGLKRYYSSQRHMLRHAYIPILSIFGAASVVNATSTTSHSAHDVHCPTHKYDTA